MAAPATTSFSAVVLLCAAACCFVLAAGSHHQGSSRKQLYKAGGDPVTDSCANVRAHDWTPHLTRKLCESTLRSSKQSAVAKNPRDMALVAMDLLQSAAAKADGALRRHSAAGSRRRSESAALALRYCRLDYAALARTVPMCRAMIQGYKEPIYPNPDAGNDCFDCAARLGSAAAGCWSHVLADDDLAKVVSGEVREVFQRATLVRAMIEEMIGFADEKH